MNEKKEKAMRPDEEPGGHEHRAGEFASCAVIRPADPCIIVIVGASGDLTARKLVPALFRLFSHDGLPEPFQIVGCGRTPWTTEEFVHRMGEAVARVQRSDIGRWEAFASRLHYRRVEYDEAASFHDLGEYLQDLDEKWSTGGNRIFYLAVPPAIYGTVSALIGGAGLAREGGEGKGWSRIVVEKPFGRDLESARKLERGIRVHFREHQIFRIDHYLAKETVQNVLMFRFANAVFEPVWNRGYVDWVSITAAETLGVGHRAGYYEDAGVLRDMFQNHMMQLLALVAMEPPSRFDAERVRDEKAKVFASLRPLPREKVHGRVVLAQYGPGTVDGEPVPGYREEPGVDPLSLTPTCAMMKVFVENWRWKGVPFYLTSGKRLAGKVTSVVVRFKDVPHSMFEEVLGERILANRLTFGIYPREEITLTFQAKSPGAAACLRNVKMHFDYQEGDEGIVLEAYEKVLVDCLHGDQMLFWRQDGVELCWSFLTPILGECETCEDRVERLHFYEAGSRGPRAGLAMLPDPGVLGG
jgi:glucose-6-phosphate 1-dehydrogenase